MWPGQLNVTSDSCTDVLDALAVLYGESVHHVCYDVSPAALKIAFRSIGTFLGLAEGQSVWEPSANLSTLAGYCREACGFCTEARHAVVATATPLRWHLQLAPV